MIVLRIRLYISVQSLGSVALASKQKTDDAGVYRMEVREDNLACIFTSTTPSDGRYLPYDTDAANYISKSSAAIENAILGRCPALCIELGRSAP